MLSTTEPGQHSAHAGDTDVVGARAVAQVVDGIVSLVVFAIVGGASALVIGGGIAAVTRSPVATMITLAPTAMLIGGLAGGAVPILLEWAWNGETIGKRLVGIRVVPVDGQRLGLGAALTRNLLAGIDAAFFYLVGGVAMATSANRQRLGDRVAGTIVVRATP